MEGTVKTLVVDRGFGFVKSGAEEFFFHMSGMADGQTAFANLDVGLRVTFERDEPSPKGPRATRVRLA